MQKFLTQPPERMVFGLAAFLLLCVSLTAMLIGGNVVGTVATSAGFLVFGTLMARSQPTLASIGATIALIGQAIAFTTAFQGHPWQIDSHMLFFALLACLVCMRSLMALLFGAAIIAVHHLSLSFLMPTLIYPSGEFAANFGRTVLHAVVVVIETGALLITVHQLNRLQQGLQDQTNTLEASLEDADMAKQNALQSQAEAETETAHIQAQTSQKTAEDALAEVRRTTREKEVAQALQRDRDEAHQQNQAKKACEQQRVVNALRVALTQLEGGDLTTRIDDALPAEYHEIGDGFNAAIQSLEELVAEVARHSEEMASDIRDISLATDNLAKRTETQAANLQRTSETMDRLTRHVQENVSNVDAANTTSQGAETSAQASGVVVSDASVAMSAIRTEAEEIAKIVTLIEGISFQTNLLALNAGVEAARAGEAGRGFAVVASEVRALAQRSSESVTSIRALIERSTQQVEKGSNKITETVDSLQVVENAISAIGSKMALISISTQEQSIGISSINTSIFEMGNVTQQNAAMFEETNAACMNLAHGAGVLQQLTQRFKVSGSNQSMSKVA